MPTLSRRSILICFALMVATGAFVVCAVVEVRSTRLSRGGLQCRGNLTAIADGLLSYHQKYGSLPPAYVADQNGEPMHSWRVLILEFLDKPLYDAYQFDEPWNGPNNEKLAGRALGQFFCPNSDDARKRIDASYLVIVGPGTAFPGTDAISLDEITGDWGRTILVVEVAESKTHWMEPQDLALAEFLRLTRTSRYQHPNGRHLVMLNAEIRQMKPTTELESARWMATVTGEDDP